MSPELNQVLLTIAVLAITVMLPAAPTLLLYKLLPQDSVVVSGPLQGLTIKAAGAFAAYLITFIVVTPFAWRTFNIVTAMISPTWTISGTVVAYDYNGKAIDSPQLLNKIEANYRPEIFQAPDGRLRTKIPEVDGSIPTIVLTIRDFGSTTIDLENPDKSAIEVDRNENKRRIDIVSKIALKQFAPEPYGQPGAGLGAPSTTVPPPPPAGPASPGVPPP